MTITKGGERMTMRNFHTVIRTAFVCALAACASFCFADELHENAVPYKKLSSCLPKDNSITSVRKCIANNFANETYTEDLFSYLLANNMESYVVPFLKVLHDEYPAKNYRLGYAGYWTNPIYDAIEKDDAARIQRYLSAAPDLLHFVTIKKFVIIKKGDYFSDRRSNLSTPPLERAVSKGNVATVKVMLPFVSDINKETVFGEWYGAEEAPRICAENLLTFSRNKQIDTLLIAKGIAELCSCSYQMVVNVDEAHIYADRTPQSRILKTVHLNDTLNVIAYTYKQYKVDRDLQRWIEVRLDDGTTGWIFGTNIQVW